MADSDQWYTPDTQQHPVLSLVARALGGSIGLDPTADPDRRVRSGRHITEVENCLIQQARGEPIYCNPPFSNPLPFVLWVAGEVESGRSPQAIMLCKSGVLSNQGTGKVIEAFASATCHWRHGGRIRFIPGEGVLNRLRREFEEGKRKSCRHRSADFDTVLINFGEVVFFAETFADYGHVQLCRKTYEGFL